MLTYNSRDCRGWRNPCSTPAAPAVRRLWRWDVMERTLPSRLHPSLPTSVRSWPATWQSCQLAGRTDGTPNVTKKKKKTLQRLLGIINYTPRGETDFFMNGLFSNQSQRSWGSGARGVQGHQGAAVFWPGGPWPTSCQARHPRRQGKPETWGSSTWSGQVQPVAHHLHLHITTHLVRIE